jgi:hypothetical protein
MIEKVVDLFFKTIRHQKLRFLLKGWMGQKCWGMKEQTEGWSDVRLGQVGQVLRMFNP